MAALLYSYLIVPFIVANLVAGLPYTVDKDIYSCRHNGRVYQNGERFQVKCNTCTCDNGQVSCTEIACGQGCDYKGQWYRNGQSFKDKCNTCTCHDGRVGCTKIGCQGCDYKGQWYRNGQSFKDDCNTCNCHDGSVGCTKIGCPKTCTYNGVVYKPGQSFPVDCNMCTCRGDGSTVCTLIQCNVTDTCATVRCGKPACSHPVTPPGSCCGVCNQGCFVKGKTYRDGESIQPCDDPCSACVCRAGSVIHLPRDCARRPCTNPVILPGTCCPICTNDSY